MAQVSVNAIAEVTGKGVTTGSVWCVVPPSTLQHYVGITSVSMAQSPIVDYVATAGTLSANATLPSCTLSVGGDGFQVSLGGTVFATYSNLQNAIVRENWTRTS